MNLKTPTEVLRETIEAALNELKVLSTKDNIDTDALVEIGAALWNVTESAKRIIEPVKTQLREEALALLKHQPGTKVLQGRDHICTVILPVSKLDMVKAVDVERLRKLLGDDFEYVFDVQTKVKPHKKLEVRVMDLGPDEQKAVLAAVERKENTARVGFKKDRK